MATCQEKILGGVRKGDPCGKTVVVGSTLCHSHYHRSKNPKVPKTKKEKAPKVAEKTVEQVQKEEDRMDALSDALLSSPDIPKSLLEQERAERQKLQDEMDGAFADTMKEELQEAEPEEEQAVEKKGDKTNTKPGPATKRLMVMSHSRLMTILEKKIVPMLGVTIPGYAEQMGTQEMGELFHDMIIETYGSEALFLANPGTQYLIATILTLGSCIKDKNGNEFVGK